MWPAVGRGNDLKNFTKITREMIDVAKSGPGNCIAKAGFKRNTGKFAETIMPTVLAKVKAVTDNVGDLRKRSRKVTSK